VANFYLFTGIKVSRKSLWKSRPWNALLSEGESTVVLFNCLVGEKAKRRCHADGGGGLEEKGL
jgi:hypothetical protein